MIFVLLVALLVSPVGFASVIFQDDFESQSSMWDIGDGALTTPSGQSGTWNYWDRASCASYPCGKCDQLPSNANGWMTYIDSTNGRAGGKALKWVNVDACNLASNNYQGTIKWDAPNNTTKDLYWGAYWKFDPVFKMAGNNGCKIGHRVWWWDSSAAKEDFWMSIQDMRFQGASDWKLYSTYNQTTYDYVIAAPDSSGYYDGNWHWFEFHLKLNSAHTDSDGALEVWMDGTKYVNLQNQNFTSFNAPSGSHTGWYIKEIQTLLGDCQLQPYNFLNTTWQGFLVDDFKVSTTYIGPEGTPAVPAITSSLTASGSVGAAFSYQIVASNSPTSYGASGLPSGLTVNTSTGLISGTPTSASTTNATITAANASGSDSKTLQITVSSSAGGATLFAETFEDTNFASRGWFDSPAGTLSTAEKYSGSSSLQCTIAAGGTGCSGSTPRRHAISPTDEVYISYYIKYAAGYNLGSHETYLLTNKDAGADGTTASNLAWTHLTVYLDQNNDNPWMSLQDGQNFSRSNPGVNLCAVTESRAVAGGNGNCDGIGSDSYWYDGTDYINTKWWTTTGHDLVDGAWHHVEARVRLNTVSGAIGQPNGIAQYWLDGNLVFNYTNVIFRTAANSDMLFTQYVFSPYTGSPPASSMTFYIDDLLVMDGMPAVSSFTVTPSAGANGSISPSTPQTVASGETIGFTVTPNAGYTASVGGSCGGSLVGTTYTTNVITADCTVSATFADATAPVLSGLSPTGDQATPVTSIALALTTNEAATCRYDLNGVSDYDLMSNYTTTGGTSHSATVTVRKGGVYAPAAKCRDAVGNTSASPAWRFAVPDAPRRRGSR